MDTVSRGDWSRASGDLCKAAAALAAQHDSSYRLLSSHSSPRHSSRREEQEERGADEETPLVLTQHRRLSKSHIMWDEARNMVSLALPVIGTYMLEMLPGIVSIVLVGHIATDENGATQTYLDAASLAVMYINLTGLSVGFGLASAMDTLCSQAYGAGELINNGKEYLLTGFMVLSITMIAVLALNLHAETILIALGQPEVVSEQAGVFVRYLLPGIPCLYIYELLRKMLQAQNVALPMLYVAIVANAVNIGLGWYLVFGSDRGGWLASWVGPDKWLGAAIARTACNLCFAVLMIVYLGLTGNWKTFWNSDSTEDASIWLKAWQGIPQFVQLGVPGALQLCFEWWAFECLALVSGLLPNAIIAIGANAVLLNIASMVYMLYLGVSIAGNVRIGNALGANEPHRASLASRLTLGLGVVCSILCASILIVFRTSLPALFTSDPEITSYCSELLYVAACFQLPDAINSAIQGIFRGSGRQIVGAYLNFVAYYIVGIPIGIVLAFPFHQSLLGLWIGMTIGLLVVGLSGTYLVVRSDWTALAKEAMERVALE